MLNACRLEIGYREGRNNDNKYGIWYGMNHQPYCAIGLTWAATKVGGLSAIGGKWAYCPWWADWFRSRGRFSTTSFKRGDIVFFDWSGRKRKGYEQHVGIVDEEDGNYIYVIEFNTTSGIAGNQSDGGGVYRRRRHRSLIVGAGKPYWAAERNVVSIVTIPARATVKRNILVVDGVWGAATTRRLQEVLKVKITGSMNAGTYTALAVWLKQKPTGTFILAMKTALQGRVGATKDGIVGPATVRAFQKYLNRIATTPTTV
jgi:hypothetical protein